MPIPLVKATLLDTIRTVLDEQKAKPDPDSILDEPSLPIEVSKIITPFISLLLYICADEPEIVGHVAGEYPKYPRPSKTKKGWKLFPPNKPHIWNIGYQTGEMLREAKERKPRETETSPHSIRTHIRRAHWHGFWTGPRKPKPDLPEEKQQRRFGYRWLHPMIVAGSRDDSEDQGKSLAT